MLHTKTGFNTEVSKFLEDLNHPLRAEIDYLRFLILSADSGLAENIKWNGPNYIFNNEDRITMRIQPPKQIQLIFHRGAKVKAQPHDKLIEDTSGLLAWKEHDRAVATFKSMVDVENGKGDLVIIVREWIRAAV